MAAELFDLLLRMAVAGSAAIVVVLLLRRTLRHAFGAIVAYAAWAAVPAAILATFLPAPVRPVAALAGIVGVMPLEPMHIGAVAEAFDPRPLVLGSWLAGTLLAIVWFTLQQRLYLRSLGTLSARDGARIVQSDSEFAGPALVGAWRARIVLPADFDRRYDAHERELILAHEHAHAARGDAWINALVVALRSLHWFNPLWHYAATRFRVDQELACDAAVMARFPQARKPYANAMLKVQLAGQARQEQRLPVGCHWSSDRTLKERILMLKRPRPTRARRGAGLALVAVFALASALTSWASQSSRPQTTAAAGRSVHANVRFDLDGKQGKPITLIHELGRDFEINIDDRWGVTMIANATASGDVVLDVSLRENGRVVSTPSVVARQGETFSIAVGGAGREDIRIEGVLELVDAKPRIGAAAVPEKDPVADRDAAYASIVPPRYPDEAIKAKVEGKVWVKVAIAADGSVLSAALDHVEPEGAAPLGEAAVQAVRSWTFQPAISNGLPVEAKALVPIDFTHDERGTAAAGPNPGNAPVSAGDSAAPAGRR